MIDSAAVSIIIVSYNGRRYLEGCLTSVFAQAGPGCQVIVVDNASDDGSADFVERNFPGATLLHNPVNRGFAAACNQGATAAAGDALVFLNQDTIVAPGWLDALLQVLCEADDIGLATSKVLWISQPERIHLCGQDLHYTGLTYGRCFSKPAASCSRAEDVTAVSGASFAIHRWLWERLGGFDESFYMYYEETDLSWRAHLAGCRCRLAPGSLVYHDYLPGRPGYLQLYYTLRNRQIMLMKNYCWSTLLLLSPALLLAEALTWAYALRSGLAGLRAKVAAGLWVTARFRRIWASHAEVQEKRCVPESAVLEQLGRRFEPLLPGGSRLSKMALDLSNLLFDLCYRWANLWLASAAGIPSALPAGRNDPYAPPREPEEQL